LQPSLLEDGKSMVTPAAPHDGLVGQALRVVEEAKGQGLVLRVMGAAAVRLHCPRLVDLHRSMGREISDMDFVGYDKASSKIERLFENLGYASRPLTYSYRQLGRLIFLGSGNAGRVDVFLDRLAMCHTIDFSKRLEVDYPTIPLAELLLEKMQIVKLNEKDVKDTIVLLREHQIGQGDNETVNTEYVARLLSNDWGFYYTVKMNLGRVKSMLQEYDQMDETDKRDVAGKIDQILKAIEDEPKNLSWRMRAKVGTSKKWYRDVDALGG